MRLDPEAIGVWVPAYLVKEAPGSNAALLLAQLTWLIQPDRSGKDRKEIFEQDGYRWVARTDDDWHGIGLDRSAAHRARLALMKAGFVYLGKGAVDGRKVTLLRPNLDAVANARMRAIADPAKRGYAQTKARIRADQSADTRNDAVLIRETKPKQEQETARAESEQRFEAFFWPAYPARDGKKIGKRQALEQWRKLSLDEQRAAVRGVGNYAAHVNAGNRYAKDAFRWLRDRGWEDWQTPAAPPSVSNSKPGQGTTNDYLAKARAIYERDGA